MRRIDATTCVIMRNGSKLAIPANWRELLKDEIFANCDSLHEYARGQGKVTVPRPEIYIAQGSRPTGIAQITFSSNEITAKRQRAITDSMLSQCDVLLWPKPDPEVHIGKGGERFLNTGIPLVEHLSRATRHRFNPGRLENVPGIIWDHFEEYTVRRGSARYLGVRTVCSECCPCRDQIEKVWMLGWEMFN